MGPVSGGIALAFFLKSVTGAGLKWFPRIPANCILAKENWVGRNMKSTLSDNVCMGMISAWWARQSIPPELRKTVDVADFEREIPIKDVLKALDAYGGCYPEDGRAVNAALELSGGVSLSLKTVVQSEESLAASARTHGHHANEWFCIERGAQSLLRGAMVGRLQKTGAPLGES